MHFVGLRATGFILPLIRPALDRCSHCRVSLVAHNNADHKYKVPPADAAAAMAKVETAFRCWTTVGQQIRPFHQPLAFVFGSSAIGPDILGTSLREPSEVITHLESEEDHEEVHSPDHYTGVPL